MQYFWIIFLRYDGRVPQGIPQVPTQKKLEIILNFKHRLTSFKGCYMEKCIEVSIASWITTEEHKHVHMEQMQVLNHSMSSTESH